MQTVCAATQRTFFRTPVTPFHVTRVHLIVHGLPCSIGTRLTNAQRASRANVLRWISSTSNNKCGIYERELVYPTKKSMASIAPMFMPKFCGHLQYGMLSKSNNAENRGEFHLRPSVRMDYTEPFFKELTAGQLQLCGDLLFQISPIYVMQYGKYGQILSTPQQSRLSWSIFHDTFDSSTTFCKERLHRISWKSDKLCSRLY
jgi:hypothetical protein